MPADPRFEEPMISGNALRFERHPHSLTGGIAHIITVDLDALEPGEVFAFERHNPGHEPGWREFTFSITRKADAAEMPSEEAELRPTPGEPTLDFQRFPITRAAAPRSGGTADPEPMCLAKGSPASPTFTPVCTLRAGHDGDHNWDERLARRAELLGTSPEPDIAESTTPRWTPERWTDDPDRCGHIFGGHFERRCVREKGHTGPHQGHTRYITHPEERAEADAAGAERQRLAISDLERARDALTASRATLSVSHLNDAVENLIAAVAYLLDGAPLPEETGGG